MKVLCTICARGNSQGLKNKNILLFKNKPLISHSLLQAKKSKLYNKIVVSSDSYKILKISSKFKPDYLIKRPKFLARPNTSKIKTVRHALLSAEKKFKIKFDYIVDLDVTSPIRDILDLKKSLKKILSEKNEILVSAVESRKNPYFNMIEFKKNKKLDLVKKSKERINSRQKAPKVYDMNASIYIWKRNSLLLKESLFFGKTSLYIMKNRNALDIDKFEDLKILRILNK
jgi:CMP-N,N'-diacetyllegionaminic acid synthase